jgi:hypothetical protein
MGMPRKVAGEESLDAGFTKYNPGPEPMKVANTKIAVRILLNRVLNMEEIQ